MAFSPSQIRPGNIALHILETEYQSGPVTVKVLLPSSVTVSPLSAGKLPVLYILPVEAGAGTQYGDGMDEAIKANIADTFGVICVAPTFTDIPWYGNHATDLLIRQEDFILHALLPFMEATYPSVRRDKEGRWLLGFSKSGWGAYTLLLRHPDVFGYAASWDAPHLITGEYNGQPSLSAQPWGPIGIRNVFGTRDNFEHYLPTCLAVKLAAQLRSDYSRLVLAGSSDSWREHVVGMHALLEDLHIRHIYRPDLEFPHRWDGGWFSAVAEELAALAHRVSDLQR